MERWILEIGEEFEEVVLFDVPRCLHTHYVEHDVSQDNVVVGDVHVLLVEVAKLVLVHVAHILVLGGRVCMRLEVLLRDWKSSSSLLLDLTTSRSGTAPSSKNLLMAFWMFHLAALR
jgi:hypothetical protein